MTTLLFCTVLIVIASNATANAENATSAALEFFPDTKANLTKITWAHAVNSQELLNAALNCTVMMLEADVVLGHLGNDTTDIIPIMAHPPQNVSDLSLQEFLQKTQEFNTNANNTLNKKGVKLDFKSIEVFEAALTSIKEFYPKMTYPLWLNADILPGPVNTTDTPVDPARFLAAAKVFENATLSLGWKTLFENITKASYSSEDVARMLETMKQNNVSQITTFPVRAGIACQSLEQLKGLVDGVKESTLTLWNGAGDHVDIDALRELIAKVGLNRVYVDLPEEIRDKLRLDQLSAGNRLNPFIALSLMLVAFLKSIM